jgi:hypothetical protein
MGATLPRARGKFVLLHCALRFAFTKHSLSGSNRPLTKSPAFIGGPIALYSQMGGELGLK